MLKIDIVSGFLGAGKTTLIKKLLSSALKGQKIVLIENEFGDIGIDGGFLKEAGIQINEMNSGCICCSLVGDFKKALNKVYTEYAPDRILIEPSGVGKLSDVLKAVLSANLPDSEVSSLTTVVDAKKCKMYLKNFGEFYKNQIEEAKCIILSHTTGIDKDKLQFCLDTVKSLNPQATIVATPWEELEGEKLFEAMNNISSLEAEIKKMQEDEDICPVCGHHHHHHGHDADEVFSSWGRETVNAYTQDQINEMLTSLNSGEYGTILRAKGIVQGTDGKWIHFDFVPGEEDVRTGSSEVIGRICVIGCKLDEEKLAKLFLL